MKAEDRRRPLLVTSDERSRVTGVTGVTRHLRFYLVTPVTPVTPAQHPGIVKRESRSSPNDQWAYCDESAAIREIDGARSRSEPKRLAFGAAAGHRLRLNPAEPEDLGRALLITRASHPLQQRTSSPLHRSSHAS
jgi:hypothetical protein